MRVSHLEIYNEEVGAAAPALCACCLLPAAPHRRAQPCCCPAPRLLPCWRAAAPATRAAALQVRDLLSKDPSARLEVRESPDRGVHVRGLREFVVKSAPEMAAVLEVGGGGGRELVRGCRLRCLPRNGG